MLSNKNDERSPNKIKRNKQIYWHEKYSPLKWKDIKHLELEDDDLISACWEDRDEGSEGYWYGEITRMVEETDEQFEKRQHRLQLDAKWARERRYESYLRLKKEFENE